MKKVPFKNYVCLIFIMAITVVITIYIASLYKESKRVETDFYKYANTISNKEFETYITEFPNSIIYIYDKYSNEYKEFESELKDKIEELYLKNNFVYIDKRELSKNFINTIKENYNVEINYSDKPIILILADKEIINIIEIKETTKVDSINLEVFE